ncbi:uncharacterized protein SCHCODRAFT_02665716 [Schizophyllum commune H4-8]|uniref:uncharacterized protein n=1 Tax=Schizophyllum commune (strain H4-8 / FGSC 9210) TaxID=578458 RepID=UPI002160D6A2|nr:uncharacterized protein SCHCODRAFT_02665716 [Schizophyllum commune H4-8]KAI5895357.1 hypothetical protein SCHCODRAFT_02665716 [Schizophyllum commune H4-8]
MPALHCCPYCTRKDFDGPQGVKSHLSQYAPCRERLERDVANASRANTTSADADAQHMPGLPPLQPQSAHTPDDDKEQAPHTAPRGPYVTVYPRAAGARLRKARTPFESLRDAQIKHGLPPYAPFRSMDEWEHLRWLVTSGASQSKIDQYLKLNSIRAIGLPFHNKDGLFKFVDTLPQAPAWSCRRWIVPGNVLGPDGQPLTEEIELWLRDPVECIQELLSNPAFEGKQAYAPCQIFSSLDKEGNGVNREYDEMWTGTWWWEIQNKLKDGATVCPVILATDKTQLSTFSGDKQAWPVYLTIGNIAKDVRRQPSSHATILVGYLPVSKLTCFHEKERSLQGYRLFHKCMSILVESLVKAGSDGVDMVCADGWAQAEGKSPPEFVELNMRAVKPFWADLPHTDIFSCITPDLLHQVHKGVFKEHLAKWATLAIRIPSGEAESEAAQKREMDSRYQTMPLHHTLRHFAKGISRTTQWTGKEQKNMEKTFLGALDGAVDVEVVRAARGVLDFIYYAHFERHTDQSLSEIEAACAAFHAHKGIFIDLGIREHFNINKLHAILHYADAIRSRGTADGFNTEGTERLHIDLAKLGYRASNRRQYTAQMTRWLARQEARFGTFLQWAMPGYVANDAATAEDNEDEEEEGEEGAENAADAEADDEGDETEDVYDEENYAIAKVPPFPRLSLSSIFRDYHVDELQYHLLTFLDHEGVIPLHTDLGVNSPITFPVYKDVKLKLKPLAEAASDSVDDKVVAIPAKPRRVTKAGVTLPASPAQWSTALVRERAAKQDAGPLDGLTPVRVRLLFRLPSGIGSYPHPLAYVDFYTPLSDNTAFNKDLGMFSIKLATRRGAQHSAVIPVTKLLRSCHLIPAFNRTVNPNWTAARVLDLAPKFYLNPYLRHHDFYLFRVLYERYRHERASPVVRGPFLMEEGDSFKFFADEKALILRPAGKKPVKDSDGDEVHTHEVHWLTHIPTAFNTVKSSYMAYGNEAQLKYSYGMPVLLAYVKPYAARKQQAEEAAANLGAQQVDNADAPDAEKSSQPRDDERPSEANM